jgi:hypothetical protein
MSLYMVIENFKNGDAVPIAGAWRQRDSHTCRAGSTKT